MQSAQRLRHQQEMELALLSSNATLRPLIFKLDVDCFDEIFDYISLKDLCSIGLTCKHLQRLAGKYFAQNYPDNEIYFHREENGKIVQKTSGCETNFAPFVRYLQLKYLKIADSNILRYAATHKYPSLKRIDFFYRVPSVYPIDHPEYIVKMNILAQLTTISIAACYPGFTDSILEGILFLCPNLSNLIVHDDLNPNSVWLNKNIPTLKRFETSSCVVHGVEKFLRANPQIKKLSIYSKDILQLIETIGLELDELVYDIFIWIDGAKETCDIINDLHEKGHIKDVKVMLNLNSDEDAEQLNNLKDVRCITSAEVDNSYDNPDLCTRLALLLNLRKLYINSEITSNEVELLSKSLVNLEELHLKENSLFEALPFARRLPKLRIIKAWEESESIVDVAALNNDRTKLPGAEVLQIYLDDGAYRQIRWTSIDLLLDMIKIRRLILTKGDHL